MPGISLRPPSQVRKKATLFGEAIQRQVQRSGKIPSATKPKEVDIHQLLLRQISPTSTLPPLISVVPGVRKKTRAWYGLVFLKQTVATDLPIQMHHQAPTLVGKDPSVTKPKKVDRLRTLHQHSPGSTLLPLQSLVLGVKKKIRAAYGLVFLKPMVATDLPTRMHHRALIPTTRGAARIIAKLTVVVIIM